MRRTTISLPDDLAAALEREAARRRTSVSHVAREAIEARLGWSGDTPRDLSFIGIGDSGSTDTAARADEILEAEWADAILGDR
jgi:Arc/MetJ-type ribon-helix-helix transcriptional regulator